MAAVNVLLDWCPCVVPCTHCCLLLRLLIYGEYCSHMEHAQSTLNQLLTSREDFRQKVEVMGHPGTLAWHSSLAEAQETHQLSSTPIFGFVAIPPYLLGDFQNTCPRLAHSLSLMGCGGWDKPISVLTRGFCRSQGPCHSIDTLGLLPLPQEALFVCFPLQCLLALPPFQVQECPCTLWSGKLCLQSSSLSAGGM